MKEWLTAAEIARLTLPGLPITESGVIRRAKEWPHRERSGRGGGREYPVSALPAKAHDAYLRLHMARPTPALREAAPAPLQAVGELKGWQASIMNGRLVLVREVLRLSRISGRTRVVDTLVEQANAGALAPELQAAVEAASAKKGTRAALSTRTLWRWIKDFEAANGNPAALAPAPSAKEKPDAPAWLADFLDFYALPSKPSVTAAARACAAERPHVALPPERTIQWTVAKMPAIARARGRLGPRALRQMRAFVRRDVSELWPTAVYVTDGHTHHAMVAHPLTGKPFRPEITSTIDVVTRRNVGWSTALAENTWGTIDALRHAFTSSGIPDIWYVDRGSGFNNATFDDGLIGLLARFDVEKHNSLPYRSQARGVIERHHQTWIEAARLLPSYVGEDMDAEARKLVDRQVAADIAARGSSPLLQSWPDFLDWMVQEHAAYNNRPHSGLPKITDAAGRRRHMTPNECWASWLHQGWTPDVADAQDGDFRPQEKRRVARGEVQFATNRYFSLDLEEFHDRDVLVAYDIHDASKVWVYTLDRRFICTAAYFGNSVSYFPRSVAEQAHEKRVKGRLQRVDRKREAVAEEGQVLLTLASSQEARPVRALEAPAPSLAVVADNPEPEPAPSAPANVRPAFRDDVDMAKWLIAHPEQITGHDARHLLERVRAGTFRLRLESDGVAPTTLIALLKPLASQEKQS